MKKIVVILICLGAVFLVYYKYKSTQSDTAKAGPKVFTKPVKGDVLTHRPGDDAKRTLLYYSFQSLHADYSFVPEKLKLMREIADEYKSLGDDANYWALMELYAKYKKDTFSTSYLPASFPSYQKVWAEVQIITEEGRFDEAVAASKSDPFALANIALEIYKQTSDKIRARELTDKAYSQFKKGGYDPGHLIGVARTYSGLKEFDKAYTVIMASNEVQFWGDITIPVIQYFSDGDKFGEAITVVTKTANGDGKAKGLLYLAQNIEETQVPLDDKFVKMLQSTLR